MDTWIRSLLHPGCYSHPVRHLELLETHISWVVLTGDYAYKIKKPVNLGFVDYSTRERRHYCCQEELRLNRRLAPDLYLDVVPITDGPRVEGSGPAREYAVKMREFPQSALLDAAAREGRLQAWHVDDLADQVGSFHLSLPGSATWGDPARVHEPARENFDQLQPLITERLDDLSRWTEQAYRALAPTMDLRRRRGFVRECHGDLHLKNVVEQNGRVVIFDGLEFNPNLSWIDIINEVAFVAMDLDHRGFSELVWRFLNRYLEHTGDYAGLAVLDYYLVYRAIVRAKVAALSGRSQDIMSHLRLARRWARPRGPSLVLMRGVSGSGKTFLSQRLLEQTGAVRLRSDVERRRLFEHGRLAGRFGVGQGIYLPWATTATYLHLAELARGVLTAGYPVIVDATFLTRDRREPFRALARQLGVPLTILDLTADERVLRQRVGERQASGQDASQADVAVLEHQLAEYRPVDPDEERDTVPAVSGDLTRFLDRLTACA